MLRRIPPSNVGGINNGGLLVLARLALALVVAAAIAVPVLSYIHTRHQVLLGDRSARPAVRLSVVDRATYRGFDRGGPETFVVLSYADLSTHVHASSEKVTRTVAAGAFAAQLAMLKEAGFVSVTSDQVAAHLVEGTPLPRHAVLITFDGARQRDWQLADPILAHYGYTAGVFVDPTRISAERSSYLSWTQLESMVDSGRWSIGLDVSGAAASAPYDAQGAGGPAILEHAWSATAGASETTAQYQARIRSGLQRELDSLTGHGLARPRLLAYPFQPRYPLLRARATFDELTQVVNSLVTAGVLAMTPDTPVTPAYRAERLLPSLPVYGNTTTNGLFARIKAASS